MNAAVDGPFLINNRVLQSGPNLLAVELHQCNSKNTDAAFGAELILLPGM